MSSPANPAPLATMPRAELTLRGLVLGVLITVLFTAANVYFGLKAGLTFATSIPAAVISMAVLRGFKGMTVQENNIVQTVASAAGTLSSIIFVLPGMVMIGWWTGFPYWVSCAICALGGILGVMYSIPLRRALVTQSDLPYPEGVACAEVLKVGGGEHADAAAVEDSRAGLAAVLWGAIVSAAFACIVATRIFASDVVRYLPRRRRTRRRHWLRFFAVLRAIRRRPPGRPVGRHSDVRRRADRLGLGRAALLGARDQHRAHSADWPSTPGAIRFVSSAPAPSAWRRYGRWRSLSNRWSPDCALPWRPRGRARPGTPHCCRAPSRTSRSAMSP